MDVDRRTGQPCPEATAVPSHQFLITAIDFALPYLFIGLAANDAGANDVCLLIGVPDGGVLADHFSHGPTQHLVQRAVAAGEDAIPDQCDAGRGRVEDRLLLIIGQTERLGSRPLFSDVLENHHSCAVRHRGINGAAKGAKPDCAAILAPELQLADIDFASPEDSVDFFARCGIGCIVGEPHSRGLADLLANGIAEHFIHTAIAANDHPVTHQHDACAGRVEQRVLFAHGGIELGSPDLDEPLQVIAMILKLIHHRLLLGDVFLDREEVRHFTTRLPYRRDIREFDIFTTVLAPVEEFAVPGFSVRKPGPHLLIRRLWGVS